MKCSNRWERGVITAIVLGIMIALYALVYVEITRGQNERAFYQSESALTEILLTEHAE